MILYALCLTHCLRSIIRHISCQESIVFYNTVRRATQQYSTTESQLQGLSSGGQTGDILTYRADFCGCQNAEGKFEIEDKCVEIIGSGHGVLVIQGAYGQGKYRSRQAGGSHREDQSRNTTLHWGTRIVYNGWLTKNGARRHHFWSLN